MDEAFVLANDGVIRWLGEPVGKISAGDHILKPRVQLIADETLSGPQLEMAQTRLDLWLAQHVKKLLGALDDLEIGDELEGAARGVAFQIGEALGVLERSRVAEEMKSLPQEARGALRKLGVRFGAYHLYLPALLKPAPRALATQLWALQNGGLESVKGLDDVAHLASSGRTSFTADLQVNRALYRAAGFRVCGERAVRVDILERLADLIRPAIAYRPGATVGDPPAGAADGDGFVVTVAMTSLAGCSGESFASILKSLSYASEQRPGPAITVPILAKASTQPIKPAAVETAPVEEDVTEASETPADAEAETPVETEVAAEAAPVETPVEEPSQAEATPVEVAPVEAIAEAPGAGNAGRNARRQPLKKRWKAILKRRKRRRKPKAKPRRLRRPKSSLKLLPTSPKPQPPSLSSSRSGSPSATSTRAAANPDRTSSIVATVPAARMARRIPPARPRRSRASPKPHRKALRRKALDRNADSTGPAATTADPKAGENRASKAIDRKAGANPANSRENSTASAAMTSAASGQSTSRSPFGAKNRPTPIRPSPNWPRSRPSWKPETRRTDREASQPDRNLSG